MDESGNILLKRLGKSPVYVKNTPEDRWEGETIQHLIKVIKNTHKLPPVLWAMTWSNFQMD